LLCQQGFTARRNRSKKDADVAEERWYKEYTYGEGSKEMSRFLVGDEGELDRMGKEHV
jgi:hypothetical protein